VHVLILGIEDGSGLPELEARLEEIAEDRRARIGRICERLARLGHPLDADAILDSARGRTVGRPDVARALVASGAASSIRDAFTRFLRDGGPADVAVERLPLAEGLDLARACGARCSLAHPHVLDHALVRDLFVRYRDRGLDGLEAYYGRYGPAQREGWLRLADDLDLVVTGGSDFHGDVVPEVTRPGIDLPAPRVGPLLTWLGLA
jgi:predicted metal-dependent phosphoesterase TrpH